MLQAVAGVRAAVVLLMLGMAVPVSALDWLPVSAEELQMKSEPKAPKAAAIYLYRLVDRNDEEFTETIYSRIKVLTEEGRKHANIEIPYLNRNFNIRGLEARVIQPDGSIVEFDGTVHEKQLVKARGVKVMAKTFTLPNVTVGSIVEYRYRRLMPANWAFDSRWLLSDDLFTRRGEFSLRPATGLVLHWSWPLGLPEGATEPRKDRGLIRMEVRDVPAFVSEEFMPPEDVMKFRVEFDYQDSGTRRMDPEAYWKAFGKRSTRQLENFVGSRRSLEEEVARVVQPDDSPEIKARKLYARVLNIRNLSFERAATEQEVEREKIETNVSAKDVLKRGYGQADDITWLLYGLLRAAGLDASILLVSPRYDNFFSPETMNSGQLTTCVILLKLGGQDVFLDPGTPLTPFGLLPWGETAIKGLQLGDGDAKWVTTALPSAEQSRVERKLNAKLNTSGTLEGKITATYVGLEAAWRRVNQRNEDETDRRKYLESEVEYDVPAGIDIKLVNSPAWSDGEAPLVAEFEIRVPGWATFAGNRMLFPIGLFGGSERRTFEHSTRVHPVYFSFPFRHLDESVIELPAGWQLGTAPQPQVQDIKVARYQSAVQSAGGVITLKREFVMGAVLIQQRYYQQLRDFYQSVRAGDEEQLVLSPAPAAKR